MELTALKMLRRISKIICDKASQCLTISQNLDHLLEIWENQLFDRKGLEFTVVSGQHTNSTAPAHWDLPWSQWGGPGMHSFLGLGEVVREKIIIVSDPAVCKAKTSEAARWSGYVFSSRISLVKKTKAEVGLGATSRICLPHDSWTTSHQSLCLLLPLPVLLVQVGGQNIFLPAVPWTDSLLGEDFLLTCGMPMLKL